MPYQKYEVGQVRAHYTALQAVLVLLVVFAIACPIVAVGIAALAGGMR